MKEEQNKDILAVNLRYTAVEDALHLKKWLENDEVRMWFPMHDEVEINDSVNRWISFYRYKCSLTAVDSEGTPCGLTTLYLQPYKTLMHQSEFGIIVPKEYQKQGIGSLLMRNVINLAKNYFHLEFLHLTTRTGNPAIRLYEKFGFVKFGEQENWAKESDGTYWGRVFMQKDLRGEVLEHIPS